MRASALVAAVTLMLGIVGSAFGQGLGYSIWEQPTGEKESIASFVGHTGLATIPSALVGPPQSLQVFAHWTNTNWQIGTEEQDLWAWGASAAITGNIEVYALRLQNVVESAGSRQTFEDETVVGAKYNVDIGRWTQNPDAPQLAVGVWDIANEVNRAYYVALTKELHLREPEGPSDLVVTLGFGNNELNDGALDGFFAGVEFAPMPRVRLQAEYDAEDFNFAARLFPTRNLSIDVASMDSNLCVGATYRIGYK
ncbi:MAG: YjbH domain-containing protein [Armatimonadetes bacterium]|nr:YjbH domain-containing protein [Armatimonadota bacterium]